MFATQQSHRVELCAQATWLLHAWATYYDAFQTSVEQGAHMLCGYVALGTELS